MKTESVMLITDARQILSKGSLNRGQRKPAGGGIGWAGCCAVTT